MATMRRSVLVSLSLLGGTACVPPATPPIPRAPSPAPGANAAAQGEDGWTGEGPDGEQAAGEGDGAWADGTAEGWGDDQAVASPAPAAPSAAPPSPGAAGSLTFAVPPGFEDNQGWYMSRIEEPGWQYVKITAGLVRVMPAIKPTGDLGATMRATWDAYSPPERQGKLSAMVYRRYVGDGLTSYFVHGQTINNETRLAEWYSLHLVDCGSTWQPVFAVGVFQVTGSGGFFDTSLGPGMSAGLDRTEPFLAGLRCDGARYRPLVDAAAMAGHYHFGSGASMDYVNVYTGATTYQALSHGGEYDLRPDGTAIYKYSSANTLGGVTAFGSDGGTGRWRIERDLLIIEIDGKVPYRYRIAALTTFSDAKVAVLIDEKTPTTPDTVNQPRDHYTTKPR